MQEVILVIHLILAVAIIVLVLLQRSEGGGLGIGGSGGLGNFASAGGVANALTKSTTLLAVGFFATSLTLGVIEANKSSSGGLLDELSSAEQVVEENVEEVAPVAPVATDDVVETSKDAVESVVEEVKEEVGQEVAPVAPISE